MPSSAIFILDLKGQIVIARDYRGDIPMSQAEKFSKHILEDDAVELSPVILEDGFSFVYIKHKNLYLMVMTKRNANVMVITHYLFRLVEVMEDYFNELNDESIRDNFVIAYELMDEMMDFGYPQSTDATILKEYICVQERHKFIKAPPVAVTNAVSWRKEGIKHPKNEIFLDVIEKLNCLVSRNGSVLKSEILGVLKAKSFLSGTPELQLGLNDKILMETRGRSSARTIDMEDVRFHQCVRLSRFDNDRTISFIPPDGEFDLMSYRLNTKIRPLIWIESQVERHSRSRVEFLIKAKSNYMRRSTANDVEISIPVPADADSPTFKVSIGTVIYVPDQQVIVWRIKQFQGQKEFLLRAHFGLPSIESDDEVEKSPPISVKFTIPYFTVSGIQVRYLKIIEKSGYQALPWVRYLAQNGDYQIRVN